MVFGSIVAGATSEGGGAVAFPVMTLALGIKPPVARDFTFMIQSVGMSAASIAILLMRVRMELRSLVYCSVGGLVGIIVGLVAVAPHLPPPFSKMYFVSVFLTFAVALYFTNKQQARPVFDEIPLWDHPSSYVRVPGCGCAVHWKAAALLAGGFVGGLFSAVGGSGLDIASFAVLTLLFRVSEKVATPTSIVLMALNSLAAFAFRHLAQGGVEADAWPYFGVAVPVVCVGAPLGAVVGSHFHRLVLAGAVYTLDAVQFIGALVVVRPWSTANTDQPLLLSLSAVAVAVLGSLLFRSLSHCGQRLVVSCEEEAAQPLPDLSVRAVDHATAGSEPTPTPRGQVGAPTEV
eukprot:CAMPEP_0196725020 /NCGR_PEP_ID=MMETSP1091-20130531/6692_1 /TAXON_ID=302021 /ORGANISM="Rhodomonas sp., Strain CCMP768" /LENGTH=346 /DNA_ID=CAMNT_0042067233 /DNA_START=316 /DNA_END=1356 /DNA_ORIENTATION=-